MKLTTAIATAAALFVTATCGLALASTGNATRPAASSSHRLLSSDGIGGVHFGSKATPAVTRVASLLGDRAEGRDEARFMCDFDHEAGFGDLTLYLRHGKFVGYSYGNFVKHPKPTLTTTKGLAVGEHLTRARRLYGKGVKWSAAQGGSWSVKAAGGKLMGFAHSFPPRGLASTVGTIEAGAVGCPAMTP